MRSRTARLAKDAPRAGLAAVLALAAAASYATAHAQTLYKYRDANGVWVFTDRKPDGGHDVETTEIKPRFDAPEVRLLQRADDTGIVLVARNTFYAPVQIAFRLSGTDNVAASTPRDGLRTLAPRSDTDILLVHRANLGAAMSFQSDFQFLPGDPQAEHRPEQPYRLPFALATTYPVSQAFPDTITHTDPSSTYAIDFVMPIGTGVYAARSGVVIEVASDFFEAGLDPNVNGPRANMVRVLHDDGTMSLYAHLSWNSIRVVPGQRVARGEYLADSGNTGFTTGPHLHFVVQRNSGGRIVSVPVEFAGAGGEAVSVRRGERYTAR